MSSGDVVSVATLRVSVWAWLSDLKRQPGSQWVLASQGSMCPGLRARPWEAPSRPRGPFQGCLGATLCPYFSPDLAAGFLGAARELTLRKERSHEVGLEEEGLVSPALAPALPDLHMCSPGSGPII